MTTDKDTEINYLKKQIKVLEKKLECLERKLHHFCPDCRDKVAFESCLRCQRDALRDKK